MFGRKNSKSRKKQKLYHVEDPDAMPIQGILGITEQDLTGDTSLEQLVLGGQHDVLQRLQSSKKEVNLEDSDDEVVVKKLTLNPAWVDHNDDDILLSDVLASRKNQPNIALPENTDCQYKEYLRKRFTDIHATPSWAKLDKKESKNGNSSEDDEDEIMKHAGNLLAKSQVLSKGFVNIKRCRNLNSAGKTEGHGLRTVEFHPTATVAVIAGQTGIAGLYQVDGKVNPKIQSIQFKNFPVFTAHFSADGQELIVGSQKYGHFYYYDMMAGKAIRVPFIKDMKQRNMQEFEVSPDGRHLVFHGLDGFIHLLTAKGKEWIGSLKMNSQVRALAFNKDGSRLYSHGDDGVVYIWDMNTRDCIHKFYDDGCIKGTAIALSPSSQYMACGSDSGIVNLYDTSSVIASTSPKPVKTFVNLVTWIHRLQFNHSSEILVMSSAQKDNAVKLAHIPSRTIFENFPQPRLNMGRALDVDMSLNSGYLSVANDGGTVYLYRLKHFDSY